MTSTAPTQSKKRPLSQSVSPKRILIALGAILGLALLCLAYARFWEVKWLRIKEVYVKGIDPLTILHISDVHFDGDIKYLQKVVNALNEQDADFVCLSGDLVEQPGPLEGALALIEKVRHPVYAVPGNHEHWGRVDLARIDASLRKTGGRLLVDASVDVGNGYAIVGLDDGYDIQANVERAVAGTAGKKIIFLFHVPVTVERLGAREFVLALAGHSHGGQVRLPLIGPLVVPRHVGRYDRGLYDTAGGPLYVTAGVGTYDMKIRFGCRPEVAVIRGRR